MSAITAGQRYFVVTSVGSFRRLVCSAPRMHPQMQLSDLRGSGASVQGVQNPARVIPDFGRPRRVVNDNNEASCVEPIRARMSRNCIADGIRPASREVDCPAPRAKACSDRAQRIRNRSRFTPSGLVSSSAHVPHMLACRCGSGAQRGVGASATACAVTVLSLLRRHECARSFRIRCRRGHCP